MFSSSIVVVAVIGPMLGSPHTKHTTIISANSTVRHSRTAAAYHNIVARSLADYSGPADCSHNYSRCTKSPAISVAAIAS